MARVGSLYDYPYMQITEDVMREMAEASTQAHVEAKYKRVVNNVYRFDIPAEREWNWQKKAGTIALSADYATGTIAATAASTTITGTSTVWASGHDDWKIKIGGDDQVYAFTYAASTTATISPAYMGDTESGMSYTLYQDKYALPADFLKWPLDEAIMYYYVNGSRVLCPELHDHDFRKKYTYVPTDNPRGFRMYPGRSSLGRYQIELVAPADSTGQLHCDYIKALPEMYENTGTSAAAGCTTVKVLTTANQYANTVAGQYISQDPTTFGGAREWSQITAVAADTTTGAGLTVSTLRTAFTASTAFTICDIPDMPAPLQRAIFYGACATIAAEKNDPALKAYLVAYNKALMLEKSRLSKKLYGRSYFRMG